MLSIVAQAQREIAEVISGSNDLQFKHVTNNATFFEQMYKFTAIDDK